ADPFYILTPSGAQTNDLPTIAWEEVADAEQYTYKITTDSDCSDVSQKGLANTNSKQVDDTLADGSYYVCVSAHFADGSVLAAANTGLAFSVDTVAPGTVTSFSVQTGIGLGH